MTTYHHLLETHLHEVRHDASDEWVKLPVRAVIRDGGPAIEVGSWSVTPAEAAVLAQSLLLLAEVADPNYQNEPVTDPVEVDQWLSDPGANPAPTRPTYLVVDGTGAPTAVVDPEVITRAATRYALALAALSDKPEAMRDLSSQVLAKHGPQSFGLVCATALQVVVEDVLEPVIQISETIVPELRINLQRFAKPEAEAGE